MEQLRSRDGSNVGGDTRPVDLTTVTTGELYITKFHSGGYKAGGVHCSWISHKEQAGSGVCFAGVDRYDYPNAHKGQKMWVRVDDETMKGRLIGCEDMFALKPLELHDWWLFEEAPLLGQPTTKVMKKYDGKDWAEFVSMFGGYLPRLAQLTFLDMPNRAPSVLWLYIKLKERLPKANPWFLLQIAHFLPGGRPGGYDATPFAKGKVGEVFRLPCDHSNHVLGSMCGEFNLQPTYADAVQDAVKTLNHGFFPKGNGRYPNPSWTLDQMAEYAEKYIEVQKKGM